jgi:hypothetical protein
MAWQVLAMWGIVIVTITWFVRDERRLRAEAKLAEAARYYAHAPKYRHVAVEAARTPPGFGRQDLTAPVEACLEPGDDGGGLQHQRHVDIGIAGIGGEVGPDGNRQFMGLLAVAVGFAEHGPDMAGGAAGEPRMSRLVADGDVDQF